MPFPVSANVAGGDTIQAADHNNLRTDVIDLGDHVHTGAAGDGGSSLGPMVLADFTTAAAPAAPGAGKGRFYVVTGDRLGFRSGAAGAAEVIATLNAAQTFSVLQTMSAGLDITSASAKVKGTPVAFPGADTSAEECYFVLSAGSNAGALNRFVGTAYYRSNTHLATIGITAGTTTIAGYVQTRTEFGISPTLGGAQVFTIVPASGDLYTAGLLRSASAIEAGVAGASQGVMRLSGVTSGVVTVAVAAIAGTWTLTLPAAAGSAGQVLQTNGAGVTSWASVVSMYLRDQTAAAINTSSAETTLYTGTVTGGDMSTNKSLRIRVIGDFLNNSGSNRQATLKLKFGALVLTYTFALQATSATRKRWEIDALIANIASASVQSASGSGFIGDTFSAPTRLELTQQLGTVNSAANVTLSLTAQNSDVDATLETKYLSLIAELI